MNNKPIGGKTLTQSFRTTTPIVDIRMHTQNQAEKDHKTGLRKLMDQVVKKAQNIMFQCEVGISNSLGRVHILDGRIPKK